MTQAEAIRPFFNAKGPLSGKDAWAISKKPRNYPNFAVVLNRLLHWGFIKKVGTKTYTLHRDFTVPTYQITPEGRDFYKACFPLRKKVK